MQELLEEAEPLGSSGWREPSQNGRSLHLRGFVRLVHQHEMFLHGYDDVRQKLDMKISRLITTEGEMLHLGCYLGSCHESEGAFSGSGVRRLPWQLQASLREAELQPLPSRCHGCRSKWLASLLHSIADFANFIEFLGFAKKALGKILWQFLHGQH